MPEQYPWLDQDIACDVAVVGGGVAAALCALRFAQAGTDTVRVSSSPVGYGSTAASSGMMEIGGEDSLSHLVEAIGPDRAMIAAGLLRQSIDQIESLCAGKDCGFRRLDSLRYTTDSAHVPLLRQEYSLRLHNGMDTEWLDAQAACRQFTFPMEAGVYTKGTAAQVDPYRFAHAMATQAHEQGARLYENTAVVTLEEEEDAVVLQCSTRRQIRAGYVIIAAGLDTRRFCGGLDRVRTTYMVATDPVDDFSGWRGPCAIRREGEPRLYVTVTADNRILMGGMDSAIIDEKGRVAGMLPLSAAAHKRQDNLCAELRGMFPAIRDLTVHYVFAARDGRTDDGLPVIGRLAGDSRTAYALCCGDSGIAYAEAASRLLLDQYQGNSNQELGLFSPKREWRVKR